MAGPPEVLPPGSGEGNDGSPGGGQGGGANFGPPDLNPAVKNDPGGPADLPPMDLGDQIQDQINDMLNGVEIGDGVSDMLNGVSINDDSDETDEMLGGLNDFDAILGGDDDGFRAALAAGTIDDGTDQDDTDQDGGADSMLAGFGIDGIAGGEAAETGDQDDELDDMMGGFGGADAILGGDQDQNTASEAAAPAEDGSYTENQSDETAAEPAEPPPPETDDDG